MSGRSEWWDRGREGVTEKGAFLKKEWLNRGLRKGWNKLEGGLFRESITDLCECWKWSVREKRHQEELLDSWFTQLDGQWCICCKEKTKEDLIWAKLGRNITNLLLNMLLLKYPSGKTKKTVKYENLDLRGKVKDLNNNLSHLGMEQFRKKQKLVMDSNNIIFIYLLFTLSQILSVKVSVKLILIG